MVIQAKTKEIHWCVLGWNPGTQANNNLKRIVGEDIKSFPPCNIGNGFFQWDVSNNLTAYSELTTEQQQEVSNQVNALVSRLTQQIGKEEIARCLTCIPSDKFLYAKLDNCKVDYIVLAAWGFKSLGKVDNSIIEGRFSVDKKHPVNIAFVDHNQPIPHRNFVIKHELNDTIAKTDQDGFFCFGKAIRPTTMLRVVDTVTGKPFEVVVDEKEQNYLLDVTEAEDAKQLHTDYTIRVVNQEGTPTPHYKLIIQGEANETDDNATICKKNHVYTRLQTVVKVSDLLGNTQEYRLSEDPKLNNFVFQWTEVFHSSLLIKVRYDDGIAVPNKAIYIRTTSDTRSGLTDVNGNWKLDNLKPEEQIEASCSDNFQQSQSVTLERGSNELTITINREPKPEPQLVRISIADIDGTPIPELTVSVITCKGTISAVTNNDGNIWIPADNFEHREKVRVKFIYKGKNHSQKVSK